MVALKDEKTVQMMVAGRVGKLVQQSADKSAAMMAAWKVTNSVEKLVNGSVVGLESLLVV